MMFYSVLALMSAVLALAEEDPHLRGGASCGGLNWKGPQICEPGFACVAHNKFWSQCLPVSLAGSENSGRSLKARIRGQGVEQYRVLPHGITGYAITTRFWDCSKPSCAWPGKGPVTKPVRACYRDGVTKAPYDYHGFTCTKLSPWRSRTDKNLSFGFAAYAAYGGEARACCTCFELKFLQPPLVGKKMVVQIVNTHNGRAPQTFFDLQVPGGGVGNQNSCAQQYYDFGPHWGAAYGGLAGNTCGDLPAPLHRGCDWQYTWLRGAGVPPVSYKEVTCPKVLLAKTGCRRTEH